VASIEISCRKDLRDETCVSMIQCTYICIYICLYIYLVDKEGSKSLSVDTTIALISVAIRPNRSDNRGDKFRPLNIFALKLLIKLVGKPITMTQSFSDR